ncbi:MAG: arsenate reductase (glutaredoxin) [Bacteroidota bacterium]
MAAEYTIYHNPRCRKSREALQLLESEGANFETIKYLDDTLSRDDLKKLLAKLNLDVQSIIRKEEKLYKEKYKNMNFTDEEWLIILEENPKLIQRPIVVKGNKAVIGRPIENVINLLK